MAQLLLLGLLGELRPRLRVVEMEPLLLGRREIRVVYPGRRPSSLKLAWPCPGLISIALPGHFLRDTENFGEDLPHKLGRARFSRMNPNFLQLVPWRSWRPWRFI